MMLLLSLGIAILAGVWGWSVHQELVRITRDTLQMHGVYVGLIQSLIVQQKHVDDTLQSIGAHLVAVRATLESVVRVEPPREPPDISPHLQGLAESVTILRETIASTQTTPDDVRAQLGGLAESVEMLRTAEQRRSSAPRLTAMEAPQVPRPHGEAKTLLLMNSNHSVAHEVTWHRDVPKTYAYAGRVFELLGVNEQGQWEFLPC